LSVVANGQVDAVVGGFSAATFNAVIRGLDLRIVASMGRQPHQGYPSALMVRKDLLDSGAVKQIQDLRGRKVALSGGMGATGAYWMSTKLRPAGLSLADSFPDMIAAFKSKAIGASLTYVMRRSKRQTFSARSCARR
jgi:NitT/TauT family transport system substrate-binding protein